MGGIRYINGFPDEPPPRIHISLGDSLAGMFAVQGILAALYRRDALGGGRGQVVDVSLMEACFALLESMVPEYDRLGIVRGPGGTGLKGVAPSNIFKSSDGKWMVIAANADKVFGRLCEAMGRPELADDPKFATHLARGENQEELEGIVAEWAGGTTAAEIDRVLNEAGVICGPIYTIADIFEDEQFQARDMLVEHDDPEFGPYIGPGIVPKFSETPGEVRWSATWEEGSHNQDVYGGLLGLSDDELAELKERGRPVSGDRSATSPRATGSRTRRSTSSRRRAPSSSTGSPPPGCRGSRRSASSTRRACRRWPAPRRSSPAIDRRDGRRLRRPRPERARLRPARRDRARRGARRLRRDRDVQPAQPERLAGGVARGRAARSSTARTRTASARR